MDATQLPADVLTALINSGHIWIFMVVWAVPILVIPFAGWLWKHFEAQHQKKDLELMTAQKHVIDLEREKTKRDRDAQFADFDHRITTLHTASIHKDEEQDLIIQALKGDIEKLYEENKLLKEQYFKRGK